MPGATHTLCCCHIMSWAKAIAVASLLPSAFMLHFSIRAAAPVEIVNYVFDILCTLALCVGIFAYNSRLFKPYIYFSIACIVRNVVLVVAFATRCGPHAKIISLMLLVWILLYSFFAYVVHRASKSVRPHENLYVTFKNDEAVVHV